MHTTNEILTTEQAGGKRGSWGCINQLLINKMVMDEVSQNRRNLMMTWFDYKKAFDWIIIGLQLAMVPNQLIMTVRPNDNMAYQT